MSRTVLFCSMAADPDYGSSFGSTIHEHLLPREERRMDGHNFHIVLTDGETAMVTDGTRTAPYRPVEKGAALEMRKVRVRPGNIAPGMFCEATIVTLTDGRTEVLYAPDFDLSAWARAADERPRVSHEVLPPSKQREE